MSEKSNYPQHPEWSEFYSAIDGIAKEDRNFHEDGLGGKTCEPAQRAIRSDVEKIIELNDEAFNQWLSQRREASKKALAVYELISSIPNLRYGAEEMKYDLSAITHLGDHIEVLKQGIDYLDKIEQLRNEINSQ